MEDKFIKAVSEKNLIRIRLSISNELMLDPRGKSYRDMVKYAESHVEDLFQENDGKEYDMDTTKWDEEYLCDLKNDLDLNFSKEKLGLFEQVVAFVLREKAEELDSEEQKARIPVQTSAQNSSNGSQTMNEADKSSTAKTLIYGGAALSVLGIIVHKMPMTIFGIIGVVAGCYLNKKDS